MSLTQNRHALKVKLVDDAEKYQNKNAIKAKIEGGGGGTVTVDDALSKTSENPVQNKVITGALNTKQNILTAGDNITIENNVISASGGGDSGVPRVVVRTEQFIDENLNRYIRLWKDDAETTPYTWGDFVHDVWGRSTDLGNPIISAFVFRKYSSVTPATDYTCNSSLDFASGSIDTASQQIQSGMTLTAVSPMYSYVNLMEGNVAVMVSYLTLRTGASASFADQIVLPLLENSINLS